MWIWGIHVVFPFSVFFFHLRWKYVPEDREPLRQSHSGDVETQLPPVKKSYSICRRACWDWSLLPFTVACAPGERVWEDTWWNCRLHEDGVATFGRVWPDEIRRESFSANSSSRRTSSTFPLSVFCPLLSLLKTSVMKAAQSSGSLWFPAAFLQLSSTRERLFVAPKPNTPPHPPTVTNTHIWQFQAKLNENFWIKSLQSGSLTLLWCPKGCD